MPELPEVETTRRLLEPFVVGRVVTDVTVLRSRMIRYQERPADFCARLKGRTIVATGRVGKHLLMILDGELIWVIHLGMSGRLSVAGGATDRPVHSNVIATLDDGSEVRFVDPRTFGHTVVLTPGELAAASLSALGPDALDAMPSVSSLQARLRRRSAPIKALLLDQSIVAGLGNIYADEALHGAGISPHRPGAELTAPEIEALSASISAVLDEALASGGTTLDDLAYLLPDGRAGEYGNETRVYGRRDEPCPRCGRPIRRDVIRARSTFWCPGCQR